MFLFHYDAFIGLSVHNGPISFSFFFLSFFVFFLRADYFNENLLYFCF